MAHFVDREPRREVRLDARIYGDAGIADAVIGNVSAHGLMLRTSKAPERRSFVEVRRCGACVVGRVMWSGGDRCGVFFRDEIDIDALCRQDCARARLLEDALRALNIVKGDVVLAVLCRFDLARWAMHNEPKTSSYEVLIDGQGPEPMPLESHSPANVLCWAERQNIKSAFEIRQEGRRLARVQYLPSHVWLISP